MPLVVVDQREHVRVDVVRIRRVDHHVAAFRNLLERLQQRRAVQEAHLVGELYPQHVATEVVLLDAADRPLHVAVQDEGCRDPEADQDADQQVRQHDRDERDDEGEELCAPLTPHLTEQRRARKLEARDQQDRGERRERNAIQHGGDRRDADQQQCAVDDRGQARAPPRLDVHGAADDHRRDRQAAQHSGRDVADALGDELTVRVGSALVGIEGIDGIQIQECLERSDDRDRDRGDVELRAAERAQVRQSDEGG